MLACARSQVDKSEEQRSVDEAVNTKENDCPKHLELFIYIKEIEIGKKKTTTK